MLYLNEQDLRAVGVDWRQTSEVIRSAMRCHHERDFVQPKKLYLRFENPQNRIIAMPAFLGGDFRVAGVKWIASFPENVEHSLERASSIVVLNDVDTGHPVCIINTSLLSVIRTVSLSSVVVDAFVKARKRKDLSIGIIGLGPIGLRHIEMCRALFKNSVSRIVGFDLREDRCLRACRELSVVCAKSWQEAYLDMDIVVTCTSANERYISLKPKPGALLLNVSLRDYQNLVYPWIAGGVVVDDWDEVCREDTDIERFHRDCTLRRGDTHTLNDMVFGDWLKRVPSEQTILVNPMGMAVFDAAIAKYYLDAARSLECGFELN